MFSISFIISGILSVCLSDPESKKICIRVHKICFWVFFAIAVLGILLGALAAASI